VLSCRDFAHVHASDYLDRQLGWRQRAAVRLHLMLCDNCRRFIAQLREVRAVLRRRPVAPVVDEAMAQDLADRLSAAFEAQKKSDPPL
jgi:hypothetical protein